MNHQQITANRAFPPWKRSLAFLALALVFVTLIGTGIYYAAGDHMTGMDFYTFWSAGKTFWLDRQNPYTFEAMEKARQGFFDTVMNANEAPMSFAYPAHNLLALFPFVFMPFKWAMSFWMAVNLIVLLAVVVISYPGASKFVIATLPFIYPVAFCFLVGNYAILMMAFLFLFYGLIVHQENRSWIIQIILGILIAWCTSKPQFVWLHIAIILLYSFKNQIWPFLVSFVISLTAMLVFTLAWVPGWPAFWLSAIQGYSTAHQQKMNFVLHSLFQTWLPEKIALPLFIITTGLLVLGLVRLLISWWNGKTSPLVLFAWSGLITYSIDPVGFSYTQLTFWFPLLIWAVELTGKSFRFYLFWVAHLIILWLFFTFSILADLPVMTRDWPLLIYAAWLVWFLWSSRRAQPRAALAA